MNTNVLLIFMSCAQLSLLVPAEARGGIESPETGITSGCKLPCGYCEFNSGSLDEQSVFLSTEPSLQLDFLMSYSRNTYNIYH